MAVTHQCLPLPEYVGQFDQPAEDVFRSVHKTWRLAPKSLISLVERFENQTGNISTW